MTHHSSLMARELPMEVDLDAIRNQEPPSDHWEVQAWEWNKRAEVQQAVFYIWSIFDYIEVLGWVEHTSDWDWWIEIQTTDGEWHRADCGSNFNGIVLADGKMYMDPREMSSEWHFPRDKPQPTVLSVNAYVWVPAPGVDPETSIEGDYEGVEWRFDIDKISSIKIGYDT